MNMENEEKDPTLRNNERNESDVDYKKDQANGNIGEPSAKRNIGPNDQTQRSNQKDQLENLHIGGSEVAGYGANTGEAEENAQGPGFEAEGGEYTNDHPVKE